MKKNKGFTLVELLGIIGIIAVILLFVTPSIIGMLKKDENKNYEQFIRTIELATETYVSANYSNYPDLSTAGGTYTISLQQLMEDGYLKTTLVNPRTEQKISPTDNVRITKKADGSYEYEYIAS